MYAPKFIKSFLKIKDFLNEEQTLDIGNYAYQYAKFWRVSFKIMAVDEREKKLIISTSQEKKTTHTPYFTAKELIQETKKLFKPYFEGYTILVGAEPYNTPPADIVTPMWLSMQLQTYHIKAKKVAQEIGIPPAEFSALLNGHREMGIRTKGLFYYYFKCKELELANSD